MVKVLDDGDESEAFPITKGVEQGYVLVPTLFSMVFSVMLTDAFQSSQNVIYLRYRTDGKLFNLRCQQAVTKMKETIIRDLLFAGDCALNAPTEQLMHNETDCLSKPVTTLVSPSVLYPEVMYQPAPGKPYHELHITGKRQQVNSVVIFTYLGNTISCTINIVPRSTKDC